ncbi:hypothetical protein F4819DRAFT_260988 [Hypoxylon fuscum]|nr:hypothetical protein F4819DRAFT_260988 [Hypoxylon fuscum]
MCNSLLRSPGVIAVLLLGVYFFCRHLTDYSHSMRGKGFSKSAGYIEIPPNISYALRIFYRIGRSRKIKNGIIAAEPSKTYDANRGLSRSLTTNRS